MPPPAPHLKQSGKTLSMLSQDAGLADQGDCSSEGSLACVDVKQYQHS